MSKRQSYKEKFIRSRIPINDLYRIGFFKSKTDLKHIEERICEFFGIKNIFMYDFIGQPRSKTVKANIETFSTN